MLLLSTALPLIAAVVLAALAGWRRPAEWAALGAAFLWGAVAALLARLGADRLFLPLEGILPATAVRVLAAVLLAPVLEELLKPAVLPPLVRVAAIGSWEAENHRRDARATLKGAPVGALLGVATGLGFAALESGLGASGGSEGGLGSDWLVGRLLGVSVMHAVATGLVGWALGRLNDAGRLRVRAILPLALLAAMGLHALWNGVAAAALGGLRGAEEGLVILQAGMSVLFLILAGAIVREERARRRTTPLNDSDS